MVQLLQNYKSVLLKTISGIILVAKRAWISPKTKLKVIYAQIVQNVKVIEAASNAVMHTTNHRPCVGYFLTCILIIIYPNHIDKEHVFILH